MPNTVTAETAAKPKAKFLFFSIFLNTLVYYYNELLFDKFALIVNQITKCF